ncbi:MAG TPA: hypothetical protein VEF04_00940, partial [Blastocatellia bacterium]|nr:hypothetical protein [Blastocatellia bacterium]
MQRNMIALVFMLLLPLAALAQADPAKAAKAQEVLKQARAAIGDEAKLKALQSLSASGSFRRAQGEREVNGEIEFDILTPDKIRLSMTTLAPFEITQISAINGDLVWTDFSSAMGGPGGGPGGGGFRMMGPDANDPQGRERQNNNTRANLLRMELALLLLSPSTLPLEYSYAAEAQTPEGKADVIDVSGPGNFKARLVIDQATHRLFMLSYKGRQLRFNRGPGGPGGPGGGPGAGPGGGQ